MLAKLRNKRGFTLVELMIVVAIIGVLAALAIYGVKKYLSSAKTAEARGAVGRIAKDAANAFNGERLQGTTLTLGNTAAPSSELCPTAAPLPSVANVAFIAGRKWQSAPSDWQDGAGWSCLHFTMDQPQYFQYSYTPSVNTQAGRRTVGTTFSANAGGDLDADGTLSSFSMQGEIKSDSAGVIVVLSPGIAEVNPEE